MLSLDILVGFLGLNQDQVDSFRGEVRTFMRLS